MDILRQLGVNSTYFIELAIFLSLFVFLVNVYFKPFMRLFSARYDRTVRDDEAARKLISDAETENQAYLQKISRAREEARKVHEEIVSRARAEESKLVNEARAKAKSITHDAMNAVSKEKEKAQTALGPQVESFAEAVTNKLLVGAK